MARPASTYRAARREAWKVQYRKNKAPWRGILYKRRATKREMPRIHAMPPPRYAPPHLVENSSVARTIFNATLPRKVYQYFDWRWRGVIDR